METVTRGGPAFMLWYDIDGTLDDRVTRAARTCFDRHHRWPTKIQVNPIDFPETSKLMVFGGTEVPVETGSYVLRGHLHVGLESSRDD